MHSYLPNTGYVNSKASSVWNEPQASPSAFIAAAQTCLVSSQPSQVTAQPS